MTTPPRYRPRRDERDQQINTQSRSYALEIVTAITQVLTVVCAVKGNPAWRGCLSILFFAAAAGLFYRYRQYQERPYRLAGAVCLAAGLGLLGWFILSG